MKKLKVTLTLQSPSKHSRNQIILNFLRMNCFIVISYNCSLVGGLFPYNLLFVYVLFSMYVYVCISVLVKWEWEEKTMGVVGEREGRWVMGIGVFFVVVLVTP